MVDDDALDDESSREYRTNGMTVVFDMEEWKSRAILVLIAITFPTVLLLAAGQVILGLVFFGCSVLLVLISYYIVKKYPKVRPLAGYVESHEGLPEGRPTRRYQRQRL